jgi:hypothetical protein
MLKRDIEDTIGLVLLGLLVLNLSLITVALIFSFVHFVVSHW